MKEEVKEEVRLEERGRTIMQIEAKREETRGGRGMLRLEERKRRRRR